MTALIDRIDLVALMAVGGVAVVDALPRSYYDRAHLPGALNLVEADVDALAAELLPDRSATVVTYCSGPSCANSAAVARRLERLGYTDVRKYAGGLEDWAAAGLAVESTAAAS